MGGGAAVTWQGGKCHCILDPRGRARGPSTHRQIDVTAALTQDPHHLQKAPPHGHMQRCAPGAVKGIGPAPGAQEHPGSLGLVPGGRGSGRRAASTCGPIPHPVPAGASPQGRVVQRRVALIVRQVCARPCLQQQPHQLHLAQVGSHLQGGPALVLGVHLPGEPAGQSPALCPSPWGWPAEGRRGRGLGSSPALGASSAGPEPRPYCLGPPPPPVSLDAQGRSSGLEACPGQRSGSLGGAGLELSGGPGGGPASHRPPKLGARTFVLPGTLCDVQVGIFLRAVGHQAGGAEGPQLTADCHTQVTVSENFYHLPDAAQGLSGERAGSQAGLPGGEGGGGGWRHSQGPCHLSTRRAQLVAASPCQGRQ